MRAELPTLDRLPRQSASHVKNKWRDVVREVRTAGSIAITNHSAGSWCSSTRRRMKSWRPVPRH